MTDYDPQPAAAALLDARHVGRVAGPLPATIAPRDEAEGGAVQRAMAARTGATLGGFKIGATGSRMQAFLGIDHPCAGFMAAADIHPAPAVLALARFRAPQVECELAVRLARDLPPGPCTQAEAAAAVGALFAAIEIVENRYGPPPVGDVKAVGLATMIADQFYHAAAVIGPPVEDWHGMDLVGIEGSLAIDGAVQNVGRGGELLGHPMRGLAWLAGNAVTAAFGGLRGGQVVLLGSVVPSAAVPGPCSVRVAFTGLPPVELRFT
jgi:2-keto-4-pentenoate hydratase